ncbi:hypothetical protein [Actinophytocola sp.]|uniref:hypothetical protein n=1 Tax=Actinophytocola sp. TaxID=1872138 RepID=UPI002ED67EED
MTPSWFIALGGVVVLVVLAVVILFVLPSRLMPGDPNSGVHLGQISSVTDTQVRHLEVVERFTGMVTQHVLTAAHLACRSSGRPLADVVGQLCRALFGNPLGVDDIAVLALLDSVPDRDTRAATLQAHAAAIRQLADTLGGRQQWDFTLLPGQPYDENRHSPWLDSRPGLPITAVVTPAYIVDEHILCRQRVTTGW